MFSTDGVAMKKYSLRPEHEARFAEWRDKWIANAMSTRAMDADERATVRAAIAGMYESAGLEPPPSDRIVFVPSPFVARFAAGFASWIWHKRSAATDAATYAATDAATVAATRAATDAATRAATRAATGDATGAATDAATRAATDDATRAATVAATRAATDAATVAATRAATGDATRAATVAATDDATDAATYAATVAATDQNAKWFRMGGCSESDMEGLSERIFPGHRKAMLECAYKSWRMLNGGNQWSGWVAYLSFFRHVVGLPIDYSKWDHYEKAAEHSGPRYIHAKFCIVSDRPEVLLVDEQNRPHCTTGPFCRWLDGSALYAVHGVRVPWTVIEHRDQLTVAQIDKEQNAEIRRVMMELYGEAKYLKDSGAMPIHSDSFGVLFRKEIPGDEPLVMVRVENSTPEPDGHRKTYMIRVPPTTETAHAAVAWTFGLDVADYHPDVES
jgi:hypothetical protein